MSRPRKSVAVHKLEGTYRRDRHGDANIAAPGEPHPTHDLGPRARQWWDHAVPLLVAMGVAKELDSEALTAAAVWIEEYYRAEEQIEDIAKKIATMQKAWNCYQSIARRFGLTAKDRLDLPTTDKRKTAAA